MKKVVSVFLCTIILLGTFSFSVLAGNENKTEETSEFVLEIDVNKRYTDLDNETVQQQTEESIEKDGKKTVYIAILCAALVVSVVVLAVSLKRVPKEEDIDISGQNKIKKDKEE